MPRPEAFRRRYRHYSTLTTNRPTTAQAHLSRLNCFADEDNAGIFGSPAYVREELTAEMTAAMVCGCVGIAPDKVEAISPEGEEQLLESSTATSGIGWTPSRPKAALWYSLLLCVQKVANLGRHH